MEANTTDRTLDVELLTRDLNRVVRALPEGRIRQVVDFAHYMALCEEREEWQSFGLVLTHESPRSIGEGRKDGRQWLSI
jgi:hypothetical protein